MGTYVEIEELAPISRAKACWLMVCGPGDLCVHPLIGTRYDPVVRERARAANRHARAARREHRRRGRGDRLEDVVDRLTP